jgi:crotonobetainyl-CoA:carnitine CoA-transferase CaiB-like acyl-CoA transferase
VGESVPARGDLALDQIKAAALRLATGVSGVGNADAISAVSVGSALMLGLVARQRGAGAHRMLTSMISSTIHCLSEVMVDYEGKPRVPAADAMCHGFSALYRLYRAEGEDWIFLAAPKDREWARLVRALPNEEALAADPRFATKSAREANDAALAQILQAIFMMRPAAIWERDLRAADVACVMAAPAPVEANYMDPGSVGDVQDLVTNGRHPILDEVQRLKPLVRFSRSGTVAGDAGLIGQDTERVMRELGYDEAEIAALAEEGVIVLG